MCYGQNASFEEVLLLLVRIVAEWEGGGGAKRNKMKQLFIESGS